MNVFLFYPAIRVYSILEDRWQEYFRYHKNCNKIYIVFYDMSYQRIALVGLNIDRKKELINQLSNLEKLWNGKLIENLLLTVPIIDLKQFTFKSKSIIYIGAFVVLYN